MSWKTFLTLHAIATAYFGFGSLLVPELMWGNMYGLSVSAGGLWALRAAGFLASGNAIMSWLFRDIRDPGARNAFGMALLYEWTVYFILALQGQLAGLFNALNWSNVAIALLWALAFLYFRLLRQPATASA